MSIRPFSGSVRPFPGLVPEPPSRGRRMATVLLAALGLVGAGAGVAWFAPLALLVVGIVLVLAAVRWIEVLSVLLFWTLPYMIVSLPTSAFTFKLSEAVAYLLAVAVAARALLRQEPLRLPPATAQVLVFLAVLLVSAICAPPVPRAYWGDVAPSGRLSPLNGSLNLVLLMGISWLVVVAIYDVVGSRPSLYRRCVQSFILSAGLASLVSVALYALVLSGHSDFITQKARGLVFETGFYFRLAGVAYEPMFLGFYLLTTLPVTLTVLLTRPDWLPRRLCGAALAAQAVAMFLTFSSGGWAGLLVAGLILSAVLFVPLFRERADKRRIAMRGLAGAVLAAMVMTGLFFATPALPRILGSSVGKILAGGDNIRKDEWAAGTAIAQDYPLLGVGPGMSSYFFPHYYPRFQSQIPGSLRGISSLYLLTLADEGAAGFAALMWCGIAGLGALLLALRRWGPQRLPILTALTASLAGCAVQYSSLSPLFLIFFTVLVGLALAGTRVAHTGVEWDK